MAEQRRSRERCFAIRSYHLPADGDVFGAAARRAGGEGEVWNFRGPGCIVDCWVDVFPIAVPVEFVIADGNAGLIFLIGHNTV